MRKSTVVAALSLALAGPVHGLESRDGGFSLTPPSGWEEASAADRSEVLALRKGGSAFSVKKLSEGANEEAMRRRILAERDALLKKGIAAAEVTVVPIKGGFGYLAGYGAPGAETAFGYFSVKGAPYSFFADHAGLASTLRLLTSLRLPGQAVEGALPDADPGSAPPPPPARWSALSGAVTFPKMASWKGEERADGGLDGEGPGFSFRIRSSPSSPAAVFARADAAHAACRRAPEQEEALSNGWKAQYHEYACSTPSGDSSASLAGAILSDGGAAMAVSAEFSDPAGRAAFLDWLARGRTALPLKPRNGERAGATPSPESGRFFPPARAALLGGLAFLGAALLAAWVRAARGRRPILVSGASHTRTGTLFPVYARESPSLLGRSFELTDRLGRRYTIVSRHPPSTLFAVSTALLLLAALTAATSASGAWAGSDMRWIRTALSLGGGGAAAALLLGAFLPRGLALFEGEALIMRVRRPKPARREGGLEIVDPQGTVLASLRRAGPRLLGKRWDLLDTSEKVCLSFREKLGPRALARRLTGHLWGLLRSPLILLASGERVGSLEREPALANRFSISLTPEIERGIDHRIVVAAALLIEVTDPDRWHPWYV